MTKTQTVPAPQSDMLPLHHCDLQLVYVCVSRLTTTTNSISKVAFAGVCTFYVCCLVGFGNVGKRYRIWEEERREIYPQTTLRGVAVLIYERNFSLIKLLRFNENQMYHSRTCVAWASAKRRQIVFLRGGSDIKVAVHGIGTSSVEITQINSQCTSLCWR